MVLGTALGWANATTVVVSIILAFGFGYALTVRGVLRSGATLDQAIRVALAADTVSIAVMELVRQRGGRRRAGCPGRRPGQWALLGYRWPCRWPSRLW